MESVEDSTSTGSSSSSTSTNSTPKGLSAAELRERRRQKILSNQSSRLSMITGGGVKDKEISREEGRMGGGGGSFGVEDDPPDEVMDWSNLSRPGERIEEEMVDGGVSIIRRRITKEAEESTSTEDFDTKGATSKTSTSTSSFSSTSTSTTIKSSINLKPKAGSPTSPKTVTFAPGTATAPSSSSTLSSSPRSRPSPAMGFMMTQPDGSTLHPKLSNRACRILVLVLGIFLALLNAKYFLVTFFSWEMAVFVINGFPNDEEPSSNLILLIALLGMKEANLKRFKFVIKLCNCLFIDFSILLVSSLTTRVLFENFMGMGTAGGK